MLNFRWWLLAYLCCAWGFATAAEVIAPASADLTERQFPAPIDLAKLKLSAQNTLKFDGATLRVLEDMPSGSTLAQVAGQPDAAFRPFIPNHIYALTPQKALWLHFRVTSQLDDPVKWSFEFPKPYVDEVKFYYESNQGQWVGQSAGKLTDRNLWPMPGLYPRFELPPDRAGSHDIYVKVTQVIPIRVDLRLKRLNDSNFDQQQKLLLYGLVVGLLVLMSLFGLVLALAYRQTIYLWYSLFAAFAGFSGANYLGLLDYIGRSGSANWTDSSLMFGASAAAVIKMQFCHVMFSRDLATRWISYAVWVGIAISIVCIAGLLALPYVSIEKRLVMFFVAFVISTGMLFVMIGLAIYQRKKAAWLWLLAFTPLSLLLVLTAVEATGLLKLSALPYDAVVYARTFEVLVLLFAIQVHVKSLHTNLVRTKLMEDLDPLTGFLAAPQYPDTLAQLWGHARASRRDLTIAYVAATVNPSIYGAAHQPASDEMVPRCVRMLHMISRTDDTVARIQKNVFAILMPGISPGPSLAAKLSRLVALGLMRDPDDLADQPVKFLIAATSFSSYSGTTSQVNQALQEKLAELNKSSERGIAFIKNK